MFGRYRHNNRQTLVCVRVHYLNSAARQRQDVHTIASAK
jgi:hypothetical protein